MWLLLSIAIFVLQVTDNSIHAFNPEIKGNIFHPLSTKLFVKHQPRWEGINGNSNSNSNQTMFFSSATSNNESLSISEPILKILWNFLTFIGIRRISNLLIRWPYSPYTDTIFYFPLERAAEETGRTLPPRGRKRLAALTIDDGLCRQESYQNKDNQSPSCSFSLTSEVLAMLRKYDAHATFFVCTNYTFDQNASCQREERAEVKQLIKEGHELGNHLEEDLSGYYTSLSGEEFGTILDQTNALLDKIDDPTKSNRIVEDPDKKIRWFRAPQGIFTPTMRKELAKRPNMVHVLGDCYCDDWKISDAQYVANTMAQQVGDGSILILHMPEKGFRESSLLALELLLRRLNEMEIQCVTLGEMSRFARSCRPGEKNEYFF